MRAGFLPAAARRPPRERRSPRASPIAHRVRAAHPTLPQSRR
ncbi:hypothetical protein BURMUCGD2M_1567 [Burkholderia multivorans CGD2M]|uniref:Uncharacterized protein n=1 Tax=Burkholderia multivorans CGD2 TaxID=513052 RepID=B9BZ16_9BURK|nr:hypothetical protein BURMUCGD2_1471 [Burkholderia multivorans CGD2]EEE14779.1 hypothetical protein BURMUCGD2M_1567 [Burkholderia multivorans CGD2M]